MMNFRDMDALTASMTGQSTGAQVGSSKSKALRKEVARRQQIKIVQKKIKAKKALERTASSQASSLGKENSGSTNGRTSGSENNSNASNVSHLRRRAPTLTLQSRKPEESLNPKQGKTLNLLAKLEHHEENYLESDFCSRYHSQKLHQPKHPNISQQQRQQELHQVKFFLKGLTATTPPRRKGIIETAMENRRNVPALLSVALSAEVSSSSSPQALLARHVHEWKVKDKAFRALLDWKEQRSIQRHFYCVWRLITRYETMKKRNQIKQARLTLLSWKEYTQEVTQQRLFFWQLWQRVFLKARISDHAVHAARRRSAQLLQLKYTILTAWKGQVMWQRSCKSLSFQGLKRCIKQRLLLRRIITSWHIYTRHQHRIKQAFVTIEVSLMQKSAIQRSFYIWRSVSKLLQKRIKRIVELHQRLYLRYVFEKIRLYGSHIQTLKHTLNSIIVCSQRRVYRYVFEVWLKLVTNQKKAEDLLFALRKASQSVYRRNSFTAWHQLIRNSAQMSQAFRIWQKRTARLQFREWSHRWTNLQKIVQKRKTRVLLASFEALGEYASDRVYLRCMQAECLGQMQERLLLRWSIIKWTTHVIDTYKFDAFNRWRCFCGRKQTTSFASLYNNYRKLTSRAQARHIRELFLEFRGFCIAQKEKRESFESLCQCMANAFRQAKLKRVLRAFSRNAAKMNRKKKRAKKLCRQIFKIWRKASHVSMGERLLKKTSFSVWRNLAANVKKYTCRWHRIACALQSSLLARTMLEFAQSIRRQIEQKYYLHMWHGYVAQRAKERIELSKKFEHWQLLVRDKIRRQGYQVKAFQLKGLFKQWQRIVRGQQLNRACKHKYLCRWRLATLELQFERQTAAAALQHKREIFKAWQHAASLQRANKRKTRCETFPGQTAPSHYLEFSNLARRVKYIGECSSVDIHDEQQRLKIMLRIVRRQKRRVCAEIRAIALQNRGARLHYIVKLLQRCLREWARICAGSYLN